MKQIITVTILLLSLTACQNSKEKQEAHDAKIIAQARAELLTELQEKKILKEKEALKDVKENKLSHLGITNKDGTLSINTNQTKAYFKNIADNIQKSIHKYKTNMKNGVIYEREAGIEINTTHINLDLNKTKNFLDHWGRKVNEYIQEFKKLTKDIDKTIQKDSNGTN
jgi:uncharacterized lipoprotein NlpE involved in copper resistance